MKKQTKCIYCGKPIVVEVPDKKAYVGSCSCNDCIPENSPARDGMNESTYTECKEVETTARLFEEKSNTDNKPKNILQMFKRKKDNTENLKENKTEGKVFYVPVEWTVTDKVPVLAKNATEAVQFVLDNMDTIPLGDSPYYLDGSYKIYSAEGDTAEEIVEELQEFGYLSDND